ncbi:MAG: hypothetical protein KF788_07210 [Piscinibacter sp.]|nr:hypothetical protein [Piscinibacter sp.]
MSLAKFPAALNHSDWTKKVGPLDKGGAVAGQLKKLAGLFDDLPVKLLDAGGLDSTDAAKERAAQLDAQFGKAAKAASDLAKTVATQAKKCADEIKKDPKAKAAATFAADAADAANALIKQIADAQNAAQAELKALASKLEAKDKKPAVKKPDSKLIARKSWVKRMVAQMKSGKVAETMFTFAQNKVKKPAFAKGKPWEHPSLLNVGPRATKSSRTDATKLMPPADKFDFFFGKVGFATDGKLKGVLVFKFESPLGAKAQIKDALMFMCGYVPRFALAKATGEVLEADDGEGQDPGMTDEELLEAEGGDEVEVDEGETEETEAVEAGGATLQDFTKRLGELKPTFQAGLAGPNADKIKQGVAKAGEMANKGQVTEALAMLKQLVALAGGGAAKASPQAGKAPEGAGGVSITKLSKARLDWATVRGDALRGIEQLSRRIEDEFRNEADQRAQVAEATKKLRGLATQLKDDLETQLDLVLNAADAAARTAQARAAKASLTEVLRMVVTDPLMKELDGNELMPDLQIVKPMQEKLREIAAALG